MANETKEQNGGGSGHSSSIKVNEKGVRLPDEPCRFVILSNWNVTDDPSLSLKGGGGGNLVEELFEEIYWGFNGVYAHQLFPSQTTNPIPVSNLSQICLRSRSGDSIQVWYSWIK